jgi:CMP-N,N'-diacetyllegionaminic acid synthase
MKQKFSAPHTSIPPIHNTAAPKILALIAARGGSKRLPGKNVRILGGMPLIAWTIVPALESHLFCDVLVSTDDTSIADIAAGCGALVPWLRPGRLASDSASSVDVALHAVDWYEANRGHLDAIVFLQPTSPFRTIKSIRQSLRLFLSGNFRPVVSVVAAQSHPAWCFHIPGKYLSPVVSWQEANKRSQDLDPAFVMDGSIYIISPPLLRFQRSFIGPETLPYLIENADEALDIDTLADWYAAESILSKDENSTRANPDISKK